MTKWQRVRSILAAVGMILLGMSLLYLNELDLTQYGITEFSSGEIAYYIILFIMILVLMFHGVRLIYFYLTMARFMTGGRSMLYRGILFIELGIVTGSLHSVPTEYIMAYFSAVMLFAGAIDVFGAYDAFKIKGRWVMKLIQGLVTIAFGIYSFMHLNEPKVVVVVFCINLFYSAIMRIISAFTPTTIITIQ